MPTPHRRGLAFLGAVGLTLTLLGAEGSEGPHDPWLPPPLSPLSPSAPELPEVPAAAVVINPPSTLAGIVRPGDDGFFALQRNHKASRESAGFWGSLSSSTEVNDT